VVLVNSNPIDKLEIVGLPSIPFRPCILGALRLCFCLLPEPRRPTAGGPRTPPSDRGSAALGEAAEIDPGGSTPVGWAVRGLEGLAVPCLLRATCDRHRLAPPRLSLVLGSVKKSGIQAA
jgi:hypothetical protein